MRLNTVKDKLKRYRGDLAGAAMLLSAVLVFFHDAVFTRGRTLLWDAADQFYPYLHYVSSMYRGGELPLWNPFLFNGYPAFANVQTQAFYPVNFLFMPFTEFTPYAVHMQIVLHFFLAGLFMYLLSRRYTGSVHASALSALIYMFSGFMVRHFEHLTMLNVLAWLPLIVLLLDRALLDGEVLSGAFAGFFLGISILAGHPQTSLTVMYVLFAHTLYRAGSGYAAQRRYAVVARSAAVLAVCMVVAGLTAGVQLVPGLELASQSVRSGPLGFEYAAASGQLSLKSVALFFVPNYYGAVAGPYWAGQGAVKDFLYVGVFALMLVCPAFSRRKGRGLAAYLFLMAVFFLLVSFGQNGFLFGPLFDYAPGFDMFRAPANTLFAFTFFMALVAGCGFRGLEYMGRRGFAASLAVLFIISAVVYMLSPLPQASGEAAAMTANIRRGYTVYALFFCIFASAALVYISYPAKRGPVGLFLVALVFVDFFISFQHAAPLGSRTGPRAFESPAQSVRLVKERYGASGVGEYVNEFSNSMAPEDLFRVRVESQTLPDLKSMGYNRAMLHGVFLVGGYDPLRLRRNATLVSRLTEKNPANLDRIANVRHVIKDSEGGGAESGAYMPRAFMVGGARYIDDDALVLTELAKEGFDPAREVIISGRGMDVEGFLSGQAGVFVERYSANEVVMRSSSPAEGFLVLSDTFYPGWRAWVDGDETEVLRANYDFRAVKVPAGAHSVVFRFQPASLAMGFLLSLAGVLAVCGVLIYRIYRARRPAL